MDTLKVVVLGDRGSGKTALLRRFVTGAFQKGKEPPTTGCEKHASSVRYEGSAISLELWDTPGGLPFSQLAEGFQPSPIQKAHAAIIAYDMT